MSITPPFLLRIYQGLSPFLEKGVVAYVQRRVKRGKEDTARLPERFGKASLPRPEGIVVWFHGASIGEAVSLLPLLHRIRQDFPHVTPLVTTGTVTAASVMEKSLPSGCIHQYSPLDIPAWVKAFLDYWKPCVTVFVESEFWPNLVSECRTRKISLYLINAHLSEKSYQSWRKIPSVIQYLLSGFTLCLAQSDTMAQRLKDLGAPPSKVRVCGNLKFTARPLPYNPDELAHLQKMVEGRSIWVAASTHAGEEEVVAQAHKIIKQAFPNILTFLIPRHPHRSPDLVKALTDRGLQVARRSCQETIDASTDIYMVDTIGELGLFYRLGDVALLGGTFAPIGGHNPIEAALLDCALIWGPHTHNQTEICQILEPAVSAVETPEELATAVKNLLLDSDSRNERIQKAHHLITAQAHILDSVMEALGQELGKGTTHSLGMSARR